jgi:hypothetical protein
VRRYVLTLLAATILACGTVVAMSVMRPDGAAAKRVKQTRATSSRLDQAHLSRLHSTATRIPDVPAATRIIGPSYVPSAGQVHRLGPHGVALAWIHDGQVCEVEGNGGGCVPALDTPIEVTIEDPDVRGQGLPLRVVGLAVDGVVRIDVKLADGSRASSVPVDNFYVVQLPAEAAPADVAGVEATMVDGSTYVARLPSAG